MYVRTFILNTINILVIKSVIIKYSWINNNNNNIIIIIIIINSLNKPSTEKTCFSHVIFL
jgi:hypothetical protein